MSGIWIKIQKKAVTRKKEQTTTILATVRSKNPIPKQNNCKFWPNHWEFWNIKAWYRVPKTKPTDHTTEKPKPRLLDRRNKKLKFSTATKSASIRYGKQQLQHSLPSDLHVKTKKNSQPLHLFKMILPHDHILFTKTTGISIQAKAFE